tara:strand:- start:651 stop:1007 length:357 start_codon:yes stop_codon:yes gene_type:complete
MKTKIISLFLLFISSIILFFWFQVNYNSRQLEKNISDLDKKIYYIKEENKVLLSEYAAHTNPSYLNQLSSLYLEKEDSSIKDILIIGENVFIKKINEMSLVQNVSTVKDSNKFLLENN